MSIISREASRKRATVMSSNKDEIINENAANEKNVSSLSFETRTNTTEKVNTAPNTAIFKIDIIQAIRAVTSLISRHLLVS